jgi:geranylgeranyl diphosphate synthase type I
LTSRSLDGEQIGFLQRTITESGALAKSERMIEELAEESMNVLQTLDIDARAKDQLRELALKVINRQA